MVLALLWLAGIVHAQEDYTAWSYHTPIFLNTSGTGANVQHNVYNFAVLIRLNPSNFPGFSKVLLQGADIRFSKSNYSQHLPYQIERWVDGAGYNDTAVIWVLLDTVFGNSTSQSLVMHYGKTGAISQSSGPSVFTAAAHYQAALHLGEGTQRGAQAAFIDASGNGNNGDDSCTNPASPGIIGLCQTFGGGTYTASRTTTDYIPLRKNGTSFNTNFNNNAPWTISLWVNLSSSSGGGCILYKGNPTQWNSNELEYCFGNQTDTKSNGLYPQLVSWGHGFAWTDSVPLTTGVWHHLVLTYANVPGGSQYYLDGVPLGMSPNYDTYNSGGNVPDSNSSMWIGRPCDANTNDESSAYFQGSLDEFEIADTARSADWVMLSYQNQQLNQTLVSFSLPPPTLASPTNGAGSPLPVPLAWNSIPTVTSYGIQVSVSPNFSTTILGQSGFTGTSLPVSGLAVNTTYYWQVNATAGAATSAWSSIWSFTPVIVPGVPALASPTNGAINRPVNISLSWGAVLSASSYAIKLSFSSAFTGTVITQSGITGTTANDSGLSYATTYFWCANATNAAGSSTWSAVWSFTTSISPPTAAPVQVSPGDGSSNVPVNASLSWGSVAGATAYILQVTTAYGFPDTLISRSGLTATSSVVSGLGTSTLYYWHVAGTNAGGVGAWSYIWRFTTSGVSTLPKASPAGTVVFSVRSGMIAYSLPGATAVEISIHDMRGRAVATIKRSQAAGSYTISFDDLGLVAGRYVVRFKAAGFKRRASIIVTK
jgi:hypothetical protein